jgi:hypothetical protein
MNTDTLALEILEYLGAHPGAEDTLEGISSWWLTEQGARTTVEEVSRALAKLVEQDRVTKRKAADGRIYYRAQRAVEKARGRALKAGASAQEVPKRTPRRARLTR